MNSHSWILPLCPSRTGGGSSGAQLNRGQSGANEQRPGVKTIGRRMSATGWREIADSAEWRPRWKRRRRRRRSDCRQVSGRGIWRISNDPPSPARSPARPPASDEIDDAETVEGGREARDLSRRSVSMGGREISSLQNRIFARPDTVKKRLSCAPRAPRRRAPPQSLACSHCDGGAKLHRNWPQLRRGEASRVESVRWFRLSVGLGHASAEVVSWPRCSWCRFRACGFHHRTV